MHRSHVGYPCVAHRMQVDRVPSMLFVEGIGRVVLRDAAQTLQAALRKIALLNVSREGRTAKLFRQRKRERGIEGHGVACDRGYHPVPSDIKRARLPLITLASGRIVHTHELDPLQSARTPDHDG